MTVATINPNLRFEPVPMPLFFFLSRVPAREVRRTADQGSPCPIFPCHSAIYDFSRYSRKRERVTTRVSATCNDSRREREEPIARANTHAMLLVRGYFIFTPSTFIIARVLSFVRSSEPPCACQNSSFFFACITSVTVLGNLYAIVRDSLERRRTTRTRRTKRWMRSLCPLPPLFSLILIAKRVQTRMNREMIEGDTRVIPSRCFIFFAKNIILFKKSQEMPLGAGAHTRAHTGARTRL